MAIKNRRGLSAFRTSSNNNGNSTINSGRTTLTQKNETSKKDSNMGVFSQFVDKLEMPVNKLELPPVWEPNVGEEYLCVITKIADKTKSYAPVIKFFGDESAEIAYAFVKNQGGLNYLREFVGKFNSFNGDLNSIIGCPFIGEVREVNGFKGIVCVREISYEEADEYIAERGFEYVDEAETDYLGFVDEEVTSNEETDDDEEEDEEEETEDEEEEADEEIDW